MQNAHGYFLDYKHFISKAGFKNVGHELLKLLKLLKLLMVIKASHIYVQVLYLPNTALYVFPYKYA